MDDTDLIKKSKDSIHTKSKYSKSKKSKDSKSKKSSKKCRDSKSNIDLDSFDLNIQSNDFNPKISSNMNIEDLIKYSKNSNPKIRLKSLNEMCPCKMRYNYPEIWARVFEMATDSDDKIRARVLHIICDGSPKEYLDKVLDTLQIFNCDINKEIKRITHKVLGSYSRTGIVNIL
jgi:hypothetical protein